MSVYSPSGSGNVHVDRIMGGKVPPKARATPKAKKASVPAKKGMGFAAAARATGLPKAQANAVIASAARNASPAAKKANPNLKKVAVKKATGGKSKAPMKRGGGK